MRREAVAFRKGRRPPRLHRRYLEEVHIQRAGGIIALIAGIFGTLAAIITLSIGAVGGAFQAEDTDTVVGLGWGGVVFSFATIVLGAVAMNAKGMAPGILLILGAVAGAVLGGTLVAICMVLALVGGILATIGAPKAKPS